MGRGLEPGAGQRTQRRQPVHAAHHGLAIDAALLDVARPADEERLVDAAVGWARDQHIQLVPVCPFAKAVFDREPAFGDVLA